MTAPQRNLLFKLFAAACRARGWHGVTERDLERERITREALNTPDADDTPSWSHLTNMEIDRLKARLVLETKGDFASAFTDAQEQRSAGERKRLIYGVEQDAARVGFSDAYLEKLALDRDDASSWRDLDMDSLRRFRMTVSARARAKCSRAQSVCTASTPRGGRFMPPSRTGD